MSAHSLPDEIAILVEDVWKSFPQPDEPHPLVRSLARLGGVELNVGVGDAVDGGDDLDDDADGGDDMADDLEEDLQPLEEEGEPTGETVLSGVNLTVEAGACIGIVGPPGAGKSVLLRVMAGISPPTKGRVLVRGRVAPALPSVERLIPSRDPARKGLVALAMLTRLPRGEVKRRLPEIFELAGMRDEDVVLGTKLTPQQRQRVVLAMMLTVDADVVLIDVPLQDQHRERYLERIRERLAAGVTVVMTAGTADELIEVADEIVYLRAGAIDTGEEVDEDADLAEGRAPSPFDAPEDHVELPGRELPMSPDAARFLELARVLMGDRRAWRAFRRAVDEAPLDAERLEWVDLARSAGFDWTQYLPVIRRLRREAGADDDEPIVGNDQNVPDRPLSGDAQRYYDHLRVMVGEERAEEALRNAQLYSPEEAERIEWSWLARWAGIDWVDQVPVIERLRRLNDVPDDEPIHGRRDLARRVRTSPGGRP